MNYRLMLRTEAQPTWSEAPDGGTPPAEPGIAAPGGDSPLGGQATVAAPAGADTLEGAAGNDTVASGESTLEGEAGKDTLEGGAGNDSLTAASYDEVKLPEGITVDETAMGQFKEFAATNGLSKEAAQAAIDMFGSQLTAQGEAFAKAQTEAWTTTIEAWKTQLAALPDFAGDKGPAAQVTIGRLFDTFGSQEARDAFDLTGAGWHPAIISMMYNVAKTLDEGNLIPGGKPPAKPQGSRTAGDILYGQEGT